MSSEVLLKKNRPRSARKRENKSQSKSATTLVKYVCTNPNTSDKNLIRKSLFDYEREKMIERGFVLYMQRIFIFAKNLPAPESADDSQQSSAEDDGKSLAADAFQEDDYKYLPELNSNQQKNDNDQMILHTLEGKSLEMALRKKLEKIVRFCNRTSVSEDKLTGLFLFMGNYSLIILEGTEDAIEIFCRQFNKHFSEFWANNKVFYVEDNISKHYFDSFVSKSVHPMYMNKTFPPKQANNEAFMIKQHQLIKQKLHSLCKKFLKDFSEQEEEESSGDDNDLDHYDRYSFEHSEMLEKVVPEVQRIELVLQSSRFYRNINELAKRFSSVRLDPDDEDITWPLRNNYTPFGAYITTKFDYNLTYPESNLTAEEKEKRPSKFAVRLEDDFAKDVSVEEAEDEEVSFDTVHAVYSAALTIAGSVRSLAPTATTMDD